MAPRLWIALPAVLLALATSEARAVDSDALAKGAPRVYTVQEGDTLWEIADHFLDDPWRWPELWDRNAFVSNPDLIYPGDRLRLTVADGEARLRRRPVERLRPQTRSGPVQRLEAIHGVDPTLLVPVLDRYHLLPARPGPGEAPAYLVAGEQERDLYAAGDTVFARVLGKGDVRRWYARAEPEAVRHPEGGRLLGYVVPHLGVVELRSGSRGTRRGRIVEAFGALEPGTALVPVGQAAAQRRLRPRPAPAVSGRLLRPVADRVLVGQGDLVVLGLGAWQGLEPGHVLAVHGPARTAADPRNPGERVPLPGKRKGVVMVVRTAPDLSFALVMENATGLEAGDRVVSPR